MKKFRIILLSAFIISLIDLLVIFTVLEHIHSLPRFVIFSLLARIIPPLIAIKLDLKVNPIITVTGLCILFSVFISAIINMHHMYIIFFGVFEGFVLGYLFEKLGHIEEKDDEPVNPQDVLETLE